MRGRALPQFAQVVRGNACTATGGVMDKFSELKGLNKNNIPTGEEGARLAALASEYIRRKNKLIRVFLSAFSACFPAPLVFIIVGRGISLYSDYSAVFWTVTGVLGALSVAAAVVVGVNMFSFSRFLKRFN